MKSLLILCYILLLTACAPFGVEQPEDSDEIYCRYYNTCKEKKEDSDWFWGKNKHEGETDWFWGKKGGGKDIWGNE